MDEKRKALLPAILFAVSGVLFLVSAFLRKDIAFTALGCCFIVLSIVFGIQYKAKKNDSDEPKE